MNVFSNPEAEKALQIAKKLKAAGFTAFYAGGCVRDHIMGQHAHDIDIATTATPDQVEALFEHTVPVGKQFGVILVVEGKTPFEVATFRTEGGYADGRHPSHVQFSRPEEDAKRRDFTVNGLYYDPFSDKIIDYVEGVRDIERKRIRAIGNPEARFEEDKLRLLRAVRFASNLDFVMEEATWLEVLRMAPKIHVVSPERIREELIKIFTRKGAGRGFQMLSDSGLMKVILPEVEAMKGIQQPPEYHPEGDVFEHTRLLMEQLDAPSVTLAFASLFHDIGKPVTMENRNGRLTFYQHEFRGAQMTRDIMKRLRFSNDEIRDVAACVENHMKFMHVQKMRTGKLKQFVVRPTFSDELEMHRIDCKASHGMLDNYEFLKKKLEEYAQEELKPKPWVNGHDLQNLGMKPGPKMKGCLEELYELQLEGQFVDKEAALQEAKKIIEKNLHAES